MCILPIHSNSHSSPQKVDRDIRTTPSKRSSRASQESVIKSASHLTVFSQLVRQPHTCILPIHSNSHSSPQKVDRDMRTTPFESSSRASQESVIKSASHLRVLTISEATLHMCTLPIHSNSHNSPQKVDRDVRTTPFERSSRASQESVIRSASHLTVFSQLVRQPYTCVYYPYIQTAIAHLKKSIETYGQRRSNDLSEPHKNQSSNLRHTSQFFHN